MIAWQLSSRMICRTFMTKKWNASRVKRLRKALGLTQEALARRLGVSLLTVSRWEAGFTVPRGLSITALEAAERQGA